MKKLLLLALLTSSLTILYGQVDENLEYMELRFKTGQGRGFTLQPYGDFHRIGFMGRKIRPYFEGNPEAMKAFSKYRWYIVGIHSSGFILSFGTAFTIIGTIDEDNNTLLTGIGGMAVGTTLMVLAGNASLLNLQKAIDLFNQSKNPSLSEVRHLLPTLRPTASNSHVGLGLVWSIQ